MSHGRNALQRVSHVEHARWVIRVTFPNGEDAYARHGPIIGEGAIVQFRTKARAERQLSFLREGLDGDAVATVVRWRKDLEAV